MFKDDSNSKFDETIVFEGFGGDFSVVFSLSSLLRIAILPTGGGVISRDFGFFDAFERFRSEILPPSFSFCFDDVSFF